MSALMGIYLILDIDVRQKPDPMNPKLPSLDENKISHEDLLLRILIACIDILYSNLNHLAILDAFVLASSSNTNKCSWHIVYKYAWFVDYRDLREFVKKVADRPKKDEFQPIKDETALSKRAGLVTAKYEWLEIGHIRKGFQNQYKPDHKGLAFEETSEMEEAPEAYSDFLSSVCSTTFICSPIGTEFRTSHMPILRSLAISDWDVIIIQVESTHCIELHGRHSYVVILDEVNAVICQMSSGVHARESKNAITVETIPNHFDAIIGISNIKTGIYVEAFAQMLYQIWDCPQCIISLYNSQKSSEIFQEPNCSLICAKLSALRPIDLPTAVKGHQKWDKIADCYALNVSPAVKIYIEAEYQRCLTAKYFPEILCGLVFSMGTSLEIISTEGTITDRKIVSNIIKVVEENIKGSDAELIVNTPDITPDDAEVFKQIPIHLFTDNMILQRHYLWKIYVSGDIGKDWHISEDKWKVIQELFQILGFTAGIDDICTLSETSDLKSAIKAINTIADKGTPEFPPYRLKTDNDIQELFDSIG
ncbi:hypothetical protein C1645_834709 [Glomus cerebriforme]|uniref:Replication origin-binding protein domain-containing protein n=1 Tax=Glomus cerebriforme TaxID=658196 RepID=A0A397SFU1_9GLOM|nr:hypothetical protein C1645_834709 [Glomus cerebriforme]